MERVLGDGWQEALEKYLDEKDAWIAGRNPKKPKKGETTLAELCNQFLSDKLDKRESGEIGARTFEEYHATSKLVIEEFGKTQVVDDLISSDFRKLRKKIADC